MLMKNSDIEEYKKLMKDYDEASEIHATYTSYLKDLETKREECLARIEEIKKKQKEIWMDAMKIVRSNFFQSTEKKFTDIHKMTRLGALNVAQLSLTDAELKTKEWKSNRFINRLCRAYPVFQRLEDGTYKLASLEEAQNC